MKERFFKNIFFIYLIIILVIIFLHYITILSPLERGLSFILSPLQSTIYSSTVEISERLEKIASRKNLQEENENLKEKINKLEQQIVNLKMFIEENKIITQQNEYLESHNFNFINARIITNSINANPNLLLIDKGESNGLRQGMAVVLDQGILIGKIIRAENEKSWLLLITDNDCKLSAAVSGESKIIGLAEGKYNTSIHLNNILKNSQLEIGDFIVTSGFDENIPAGILIGEVEEIIDSPADLFKNANLTSTANFKNLKIVSIILN